MTIDALRLLNTLIAVAAVPHAISLLMKLIDETRAFTGARKRLSRTLQMMSILFIIASIFNATLSAALFFKVDFGSIFTQTQSQGIFNLRNIIVNVAIFFGVYKLNKFAKRNGTSR